MQARETQIIMQSLASRSSSVEDGVAVVGDALEDGCLAGAAGAFAAGGQDADSGVFDRVEDGRVRRDGEGEVALGEVDLEGLVQDGLGERLGDEPLDVQRALGQAAQRCSTAFSRGSGPQQ